MTSSARISYRPDRLRAFRNCFLGHAAGAVAGMRHDNHVNLPAGTAWPHEVYYAQFVAQSYLQSGKHGFLSLTYLRDSLHTGLRIEKDVVVVPTHTFDQTSDFRWAGWLSIQSGVDKNKKGTIRQSVQQVGGPGFAAHSLAIGLVNCDDARKIIKDSRTIGMLTHKQPVAISAGIVTALAIAFALRLGNEPGAIVQRLMSVLRSPIANPYVPGFMMGKMTLLEALLGSGEKLGTALKMLRDAQARSALDVVPGALYLALSGPASLEGKMHVMENLGIDNYKYWAICGALTGAMTHGRGLPEKVLERVDLTDCLLGNAQGLFDSAVKLGRI